MIDLSFLGKDGLMIQYEDVISVMGFNVISEGVEDADQIETLKDIGCDYIQGYVWGKPLLPEDAGKLVTSV